MEIEIKGDLRVKIDQKNKTASIIESPKAKGTVLIPRFAEYENVKYKIISIDTSSFRDTKIESVTFPEDSEVETFEGSIFEDSTIKKLQIPPKLKNLNDGWNRYIKNTIEIEISPKNDRFIFFDNKFLLGKSDENSEEFDTLYYMRNDIEEVVIPPQVKIIKKESFYGFKKLKSITFTKNSKLKIIEGEVFYNSSIHKLVLPSSIEKIDDDCFHFTSNLTEIDILPGNKIFKVIDNKYLVKKSQTKSENYDVLLFARRDIENVIIPSYIKVINYGAFSHCQQMKSITFESNSSLELLGSFSFDRVNGPEKIVFPPSLKEIGLYSFSSSTNVKYIEFLGKSVKICSSSFYDCGDLLSVSFPNADNIMLDNYALNSISKETKFYVRHDVIFSGKDSKEFQNKIIFIEESKKSEKIETQKQTDEKEEESKKSTNKNESKDTNKEENLEKQIEEMKKEKNDLERYVCYLQYRLRKFEEIPTIDEFLKKEDKYKYENKKEKEKEESQTKTMINGEDEEYQEIEDKIGEGASSEVYKVKDTRTGQVFCKKVIKESREEELFKTLKNSVKEIEISLRIRHPCICECLGYNLEEEIKKETKQKDEDDDYDDDEESEKERKKKTTIAIFIEYLPFSVKSLIENQMMSNTLKTRIALEVAFGMKHIHSFGMIHRDLKLDNIMLNEVFETTIIDLGLVRVEEENSLTKGIGTLSYMSPEMAKDEKYNNKTDVYSFGVILHFIFTGNVLKNKSGQ